MSSQPQSKEQEQFFSAWDTWAQQAPPEESRAEAVSRLKHWFQNNQSGVSEKLSLNKLNLTSLPALPPSLKQLDVSHNLLTSLPSLPPLLEHLHVRDNRLNSLPDLPPSLKYLNASGSPLGPTNQLTKLPDLPPSLETLEAPDNLLDSLPRLPASLKKLVVARNRLTNLPPLPDLLEHLNVARNQLDSLPRLPASLKQLDVAVNQLDSLPRLPASLKVLNVASNRLESLPEDIETLKSDSKVIVTGNPLSTETRNRFVIALSPTGVECLDLSANNKAAALWQAVKAWFGTDDSARGAAWNKIYREAPANNTAPFQKLLKMLQKTAEMQGAMRVAFKDRVTRLLDAMEKDKELRDICFGIAYDAVETCHDNVTLGFNQMEQAHLTLRAARGEFTQQKVFKLGMDFFKLQMLDQLAKEKARNIGNEKEELEVVLYYRTKLGDTLMELSHQPQAMRYEGEAISKEKRTHRGLGPTKRVTVVTNEDLHKAAQAVRTAASDPQKIIEFLTGWEPWQKDLARRHPEEFSPAALQAAKDRLQEELANLDDEEKYPDLKTFQKKMMSDDLMKEYNALDSTLFDDERKRLTEKFVKANTASSSQSTA